MSLNTALRFNACCSSFLLLIGTACIFAPPYHSLMLIHYGLRPLNELPYVDGTIADTDYCRPSKKGWHRPLKILTSNATTIKLGVSCDQTADQKEIWINKPIKIYYEKWRFKTWMSERRILLIINHVQFEGLPHYRLHPLPIEEITLRVIYRETKTGLLLESLFLFLIFFLHRRLTQNTRATYKSIEAMRLLVAEAFKKCTENIDHEIISDDACFLYDSQNRTETHGRSIYYRKSNGTYWHFKSNGTKTLNTQIPNEIAKVKWPTP